MGLGTEQGQQEQRGHGMAEVSNIKVYELAKELGMDSLSLVDALKKLKVGVKSHMSALTPDQAELARSTLALKEDAPKKAKKKAVVRRKKTTSSAKSGVATIRRKKSSGEATGVSATASQTSTVIRRRTTKSTTTDADENTQNLSNLSEQRQFDTEEHHSSSEDQMEAGQEGLELGANEASTAEEHSIEEPAEPVIPAKPRLTIATSPEARSLLKVVERPSRKPVAKNTPTQGPGDPKAAPESSPRVFKMNKEALDRMAEEEAKKKKSAAEKNIRPEDVRFADYRKKEVVFLPRRKRIPTGKSLQKTQITKAAAHKRVVEMGETITVQDLANQMKARAGDLIKKLMGMGQVASMNQRIDMDTATLLANEFEYEIKDISFKEDAIIDAREDSAEELVERPPVVTVMGHVDHGKTSLLDAIRDANVVAKEAGGITQHVGAYTIEKNGKLITFIDTPGHEAFSVMRARGANITDIVILVVAADDGVMPQTREAISHAKAAEVPIIVAVNKIDKAGANPEKIKQELADLSLLAEDWGGDVMFVPVSALQKTNLDQLLEAILLNAEVLELKANPKAPASGTVLEARLEKGKGPMASLIVSRGTLKKGANIVCGTVCGKVRQMVDHTGKEIQSVSPGMAAEITGLEGVPNAGDIFDVVASDSDARKVAAHRAGIIREKEQVTKKVSLEDLFANVENGGIKELKIVMKADVFGSAEAVKDSLLKASTDKVKVNVIHSATGGITESDVLLASASNALIIGFNVRPDNQARKTAEKEKVEIKTYKIIYELIDDVKAAMAGLLDKTKVEKFLGRAEVRQTFTVPKIGTIAGSSVIDGKIQRNANVRLLRDNVIVYEGKLSSLKRFKDDAKEVAQGYECGIGIENYNDLKEGDIIEAFEIELITPEL